MFPACLLFDDAESIFCRVVVVREEVTVDVLVFSWN